MARVDEFLDLVDDPSRQSLTSGDPADTALLMLMAHVAFSDGVVEPNELAFLKKVLPNRSESAIVAWVKSATERALDWDLLGTTFSTVDERWKCLRFTTRMAWTDGAIQDEERRLLDELAEAFGLGPKAVERVLAEIRVPAGDEVLRDSLVNAAKQASWGALQVAGGPMESDLQKLCPADEHPIVRLGLERQEVAAIFGNGMVVRALEGPTFIRWSEFVAYTRVATLGASLQIHTESGRTWTLVDTRLRGLSSFFDRLFSGGKSDVAVEAPVIVQTR